MFTEEEVVQVAALEHYSYCPRQCGLIHLEQVWDENVLTLRSAVVHDRAHTPGYETRPGLRVERSLTLWSDRLGLSGKSDVVEFLDDGTPYPV